MHKALGRKRKSRNERSHPQVEQKTKIHPSCGNFAQKNINPSTGLACLIIRDRSVSISMIALDNMVLPTSAIIFNLLR